VHEVSKLLTIVTIALLPLTAFAKIGESRTSFERSHTKVSLEEIPEVINALPDVAAYKDKKTGYRYFAWFQLGTFAGASRMVNSDEDLSKFVQLVLGTNDLEARTDLNPLLKTMGMQAFGTKDGKLAFNVYSPENKGANRVVVVGTRAFIETYEAIVLLLMANHRLGTPVSAPAPSPALTPADVTWEFTTELAKVIEPATSVLSDVEDAESAELPLLTFKVGAMQLKALKGLWDRVPGEAKPALKASMNSSVEAFEDLERRLSTLPGIDNTTLRSMGDFIEALKSFQP
jgi:hypothetical protein